MKRIFCSTIFIILLIITNTTFTHNISSYAHVSHKNIATITLNDATAQCIIACVQEAAKKSQPISQNLYRCYENACSLDHKITIVDLYEIVPELICLVNTTLKSGRPTDSHATAVGFNGCNLDIILNLLEDIERQLLFCPNFIADCCEDTFTALADLKDTITIDFQATWTILANLQLTATVDFSSIFTILTNIENTLTACCADTFTTLSNTTSLIISDFNQTWTILNQITNNQNGTFTALEACCNGTFTVLADLKSTISQDFIATWTILANLNPTFSSCCDQTFTVLQDIKNTLTECCADLRNTITTDSQETWTILDHVINNQNGTFTALEACCNGTFTVLADLKSTISQDFIATWTILVTIPDIQLTLTTCCTDLNNTLTTSFQGTWTILDNLHPEAIVDLSPLFTVLTDIENTLTICCVGTLTALAELKNTITTDFQGTWTMIIEPDQCPLTAITQSTTISTPGSYCLANDIAGLITISSSDVTLDLNGYTIDGGGAPNALVVTSTLERITIHNGALNNASEDGLVVNHGSSSLVIKNLQITNCGAFSSGFYGIRLGTVAGQVNNCTLSDIVVSNCSSGISLENTNNSLFQRCTIHNCSITSGVFVQGFNLVGSNGLISNNKFIQCTVNQLNGLGLIGVSLNQAQAIIFEDCTITDLTGGLDGFILTAEGFFISNCSDILIDDSIVSRFAGLVNVGIDINNTTSCTIKNSQVVDISSIFDSSQGIKILNNVDTILANNIINNISGANSAVGLEITNANGLVAQNVVISTVMATTAFGASINNSHYLLFQDNLYKNIGTLSGTTNARGFSIVGSFRTDYINCFVANINASVFSAGFAFNNSPGCYSGDCIAEDIHSTVASTPPTSGAFGFTAFNSSHNVIMNRCIALNVTTANVPVSPVNDGGCGFSAVTVNNTLTQDCLANKCNTGFSQSIGVLTSQNSIGIRCISVNNSRLGIRGEFGFPFPLGSFYSNCLARNNPTNYVLVNHVTFPGFPTINSGNVSA